MTIINPFILGRHDPKYK